MDDVKELTFEQARDNLREVVQTLEAGSAPLEETLALWKRGEALAARCRSILEQAVKSVEQATAATDGENADVESE